MRHDLRYALLAIALGSAGIAVAAVTMESGTPTDEPDVDASTPPPEPDWYALLDAFGEAISRAFTVDHLNVSPVPYSEAISRTFTVDNLEVAPSGYSEAISRTFTVDNLEVPPDEYNEAISRTFTVDNLDVPPVPYGETISRAFTVCDKVGMLGVDDFPTRGAFKVRFLDGTVVGASWLQDPHTIIGRSEMFEHEGQPDIDGAPVANGGQDPYPDTAPVVPEACRIPSAFPDWGYEIHTEILSLNLTSGTMSVRAGQPFWDSVAADGNPQFYRNSFGEVGGMSPCEGESFPWWDSFFNVFVEVEAGGLKFYNRTPIFIRATIKSFPPKIELPTTTYLHDPSYPPVPLFNADRIHVAYLQSAGHGNTQPPPATCEAEAALEDPVTFAVDNQSMGLPPPDFDPIHVREDAGSPTQQVTVYMSSGVTPGGTPDVTNARVPDLIGTVSTGGEPPAFAPGDAINSISLGRDGTFDSYLQRWNAGALYFSVDRPTVGRNCTDVRSESEQGQAAGDLYLATTPPFGSYDAPLCPACGTGNTNCLVADQTALGLSPGGGSPAEDEVTALEIAELGDAPVYMTFTGPSFASNQATIYLFDPQTGPFQRENLVVFATSADLGLDPGDVIDALVLSDVTPGSVPATPNGTLDPGDDDVLFSLAPGSPTLIATAWSPATVFRSFFSAGFSVYAPPSLLGLLDTDNVDALDIARALFPGDCNANGVEDVCDVDRGFSLDCGSDRVPDECQLAGNDCNENEVPDYCDIALGTSEDVNDNGIPDECEAGQIDLVVSSVDASLTMGDWQTLAISGSVSAEVANRGGLPVDGPFTVTFFEDADRDGVFNPDADIVLGDAEWPGLAPGNTAVVSAPVSGNVLFRDNLIHAYVDSGGDWSEWKEDNNYGHSGLLCELDPPDGEAAADLTASFVRAGEVAEGRFLEARIGNGGAIAVMEAVPVSFYDGDPAGGDLLGTVITSVPLAPGEFEDVTLLVSASTATQFPVWVVADDPGNGTGLIAECDEVNNSHDSGLILESLNGPPVADAGGPYDAFECQPVQLDGSASSDPDGDPLTYLWDLDNDGRYDDATGPAPTHTWTDEGAHTVKLIVSDGLLNSDPAFADVTVYDAEPAVTLTGPTRLGVYHEGCFAATVTSPCDSITAVDWDWEHLDPPGFVPSGNAGASACHIWMIHGTHTVAVRVTDNDGDQVIVTLDVTVDPEEPVLREIEYSIEVVYEHRGYDPQTNQHYALTSLRNIGTTAVRGPLVLAFDEFAPPGTYLVEPDGTVPDSGLPYIDFTGLLIDNLLAAGEQTDSIMIYWQVVGDGEQFSFVDIPMALNSAPYFTTSPVITASEGVPYDYASHAVDPDGDPLVYRVLGGPPEMVISPASGLIVWTPGQTDAGEHQITIEASDGLAGGQGQQSYTITVGEVNVGPVITSTPTTTTEVAALYEYEVEAYDPDGDPLTYALSAAPSGMTIGAVSGLVEWVPSAAGTQAVEILVSDDQGNDASQDFFITVVACGDPPVIESAPVVTATEGQPYNYQVIAASPGGALLYELAVAPDGMTIDAAGLISWTPGYDAHGLRTVKVVVSTETPDCQDEQIFQIDVADVNVAPEFVSAPVTTATEGVFYRYATQAVDPDGDPVAYLLVQGLDGMSMHAVSGVLEWIPPQTAAAGSPYNIII